MTTERTEIGEPPARKVDRCERCGNWFWNGVRREDDQGVCLACWASVLSDPRM